MSVSAENLPTPAENATLATRMGSPKESDEAADDWIEYMERLEQFEANEIAGNSKNKSTLLSSCGSKTYKLCRNILAPTKPGDAKWTVLKQTMENHQSPKLVIAERFKFNNKDRKQGEGGSYLYGRTPKIVRTLRI